MDYCSKAELMVCCFAREIRNEDFLVQGIATPLVSASYILANLTHAPDLLVLYVVGNTLVRKGGSLSFSNYEQLTIGKAIKRVSFVDISCELLPALTPKEFFRPAQVDRWGNFNNVVIGKYNHPIVRLPGAAGISDVTTFYPKFYLYVPRHDKRTFVDKIDFVSGIGRLSKVDSKRKDSIVRGIGPLKIFTDLCVMGLGEEGMTILSLHPGVQLKDVEDNTGFKLQISPDLKETPLPGEQELSLLRNKIDPLDTRELELLPKKQRWRKIKEILKRENLKKL